MRPPPGGGNYVSYNILLEDAGSIANCPIFFSTKRTAICRCSMSCASILDQATFQRKLVLMRALENVLYHSISVATCMYQ